MITRKLLSNSAHKRLFELLAHVQPPRHNIHTQTMSLRVQSKVTVDNIQINFDRVGKGPHPVLCLPGALGFIESDFGPILDKFDINKFTVITWDPPGKRKPSFLIVVCYC